MSTETKKFKVKKDAKSVNFDFESPVDIDNEQLVLGLLFNFPDIRTAFKIYTNHNAFAVENHKCIAWTIAQLLEKRVEITPDTVNSHKSDYPGSKTGTDLKYLNDLKNTFNEKHSIDAYRLFIDKLNKDQYKRIIRETDLVDLYNGLNNPHSSIEKIATITEQIQKKLTNYDGGQIGGFKSLKDLMPEYNTAINSRTEQLDFVSTGYRKLDRELTVGFARKGISIIAGRPGMAKSALAANFLLRLGRQNRPVGLFALEMNSISTMDRLIAIESGISLEKIIKERNKMFPVEKMAVRNAQNRIEKYPIYIDDTATMTMEKFELQLRKLVETVKLEVVFVDLFMKIQKPKYLQHKSDASVYTEMLNHVQRVAKALNVHICLVVQIGRKAENRVDKRPMLSDIKDAGAYEEIADLVLLLYRKKYYERKNAELEKLKVKRKKLNTIASKAEQKRIVTEHEDILEIHIAKQREGKQNEVVEMNFWGDTTHIGDLKRITIEKDETNESK